MSARILIVDDHDVVRQGIRLILQVRSQWEICGEASEYICRGDALNP